MLQVSYIIENKEKVVEGLKKRNFINITEALDEVIALDDKRKSTQATLDQNLAEANSISKQIGTLMKAGQREEAEQIKNRTSELKTSNKKLSDLLETTKQDLIKALYNIPNIPVEAVPFGNSEEDNEEVERHGELPQLYNGASSSLGPD